MSGEPVSHREKQTGGASRSAGRQDVGPGGRVLRVKSGYNPNSSSVGSDIPTFLAFATAAGAFTTVLLNVFGTVADLIRRRMSGKQTEAEKSEE